MTTPPPPTTPVPPPGAFATTWVPSAPTGLAWATIVLVGAAALFLVGDAATNSVTYEKFIDAMNQGGQAQTTGALGALATTLMLAAYITLGLWGMRIHTNLVEQGTPQTLNKIWIWFVWWIPLAQWVMPIIYMRDLNKTSRSWALWPWFLTWTGYWAVAWGSIFYMFGLLGDVFTRPSATTDFSEFISRDEFGTMITLGQVQAALLVAAAAFLGVLVKQITDRHLASQGNSPATF